MDQRGARHLPQVQAAGGDGRPSVNCATARTAKKTTASPAPASPNANRQSGMPMLPELGKISAGR